MKGANMWYGFCRNAFSIGRFHHLGGIYMFLGLLLVVLIVYLIVRNGKPNTALNNSESILKERLARGEISEEEYDNLIKKLKK